MSDVVLKYYYLLTDNIFHVFIFFPDLWPIIIIISHLEKKLLQIN